MIKLLINHHLNAPNGVAVFSDFRRDCRSSIRQKSLLKRRGFEMPIESVSNPLRFGEQILQETQRIEPVFFKNGMPRIPGSPKSLV